MSFLHYTMQVLFRYLCLYLYHLLSKQVITILKLSWVTCSHSLKRTYQIKVREVSAGFKESKTRGIAVKSPQSYILSYNVASSAEVNKFLVTVIGQVSLSYVLPIRSPVGLAGVNINHVLTVFALHSTAPLELAFTLGDTFDPHGVIAPPTAHDLTAIRACWWLVAHSACCAQRAWEEMERIERLWFWRKRTAHQGCDGFETETESMIQISSLMAYNAICCSVVLLFLSRVKYLNCYCRILYICDI